MTKIDDRASVARRLFAILSMLFVAGGLLQGCWHSDDTSSSSAKSAAAIEPVEGMKYYVGGPVMKFDKYGRMRLGGFNGEISSPTSRGLLLGFKKNPDSTFDYRTWLNGAIITKSIGFLDADGMLWYSERINYDADGNVTVRQTFKYDDDKKIMTSMVEHLDPETGEVVKTTTQDIPYEPSDTEKKALEEDGGDGAAPEN
jgi:hypothetical protein